MLSNILLLAAVIAAPLYVVRFNIGPLPSTLLELLILSTVVSFSIETLISRSTWSEIKDHLISPLSWPAVGLIGVGLFSVAVSSNHYAALGIWRAYILEPVLIYFVLLGKIRQGKLSTHFVVAWLASGVWVAGLALLQKLTGQFTTLDSAHELSLGRAAVVFNSANDVPLFLGPIAAVGVALVRIRRWVIFPLLLIFIAVWLSGSRGGALALGVVGTLFLLGWIWSKLSSAWQAHARRVLIALGLFLVGATAYFFVNISSLTPEHKIVYPRPYSGTTEVRLCLWEGTRDLLAAHPIFGVGLGGFRTEYPSFRTCDSEELVYPHNLILNTWTELGLMGLVIFGWIYYRAFGIIKTAPTSLLVKLSLGGALIYSLVHGLVDVPYFKNDLSVEFWLLLAVIVAVRERKLLFS